MAKRNIFNSIQLKKPKKNVFDLTHDIKMSLDMGQLVPCCVVECVPGDSFRIGCEAMIRFAPMVAPVMHRIDMYMHYFFVPNRIIWPNWEEFIFNSSDPGAPAHVLPVLQFDDETSEPGTLADYLGVPVMTGANMLSVSALPFAAYQAIYNEYYRDQNLIAEVPFDLVNGSNAANFGELAQLRLRAWEHDYFTSSLPFAQKGTAVALPINFTDVNVFRNSVSTPAETTITTTAGVTPLSITNDESENAAIIADRLYADTSSLEGASNINDFRRALRLQEWLEKNARGGTRPVESILVHFGVKSSDARLNRPEYITGVKSPVVISEVLNTAGTFDATTPDDPTSPPQGNMSGHGIGIASGAYGKYFCEEHGFIIGILSVMPKTAYQQGLPRFFSKGDPFDYFWPEFANIGEQAVSTLEIMADAPGAPPVDPFGYVPRYAEYKFMPSRVAGDFKSTLDYWHLGRIFLANPALNQEFIECVPDKRIFAVEDPTVDSLYAHCLNKITAIRPMPKYGTPTI